MKAFRPLLAWLIVIYALTLLLYIGFRLAFGADFWWLAVLNNFAPYYFFPLPLLALGAALVRLPRALIYVPLALFLVGLAWLAPRFLITSSALATSGPTLKVITFNHWMNHPNLEAIGDWLETEAADIVLLQQAYRRLATQLEETYPYFTFDGPRETWSGRLVLSRYPITTVENIPLTPASDRGLQRVVIEVSGHHPVTVYNVHLSQPQREEARFRLGRLRFPMSFIAQYDEDERNAEIRLLLEHVAAETGPTIVAGDFNTSDNAVIYDEMAALMQDSYRQAASGLGVTWPVAKLRGMSGLLPPLLRIDYIWHRGGLQSLSATTGPRLGSDHLPVIATLRLATSESAD